jgi:hypothetical protein
MMRYLTIKLRIIILYLIVKYLIIIIEILLSKVVGFRVFFFSKNKSIAILLGPYCSLIDAHIVRVLYSYIQSEYPSSSAGSRGLVNSERA